MLGLPAHLQAVGDGRVDGQNNFTVLKVAIATSITAPVAKLNITTILAIGKPHPVIECWG